MILGNWTAAGWPGSVEVNPKPPAPKPVDLKKRYCGHGNLIYSANFRVPKCPVFQPKENE